MKIDCDFEGGNVKVIKTDGNNVYLSCDQRDTTSKWFYWCFSVEGAENTALNFIFDDNVVGYFGSAVSYDNYNYKWQYDDFGHNGNGFSYSFGENEKKVYFAHDLAYRTQRFFDFCKEKNIALKSLCDSAKGRSIPYLRLGDGENTILLTSRQHACESTGTYVLQGCIEEFVKAVPASYSVVCVPFVDYDGVVDGDQGKDRYPHDHNRDYIENPVYDSVKSIMNIIDSENVVYGFDFHSPSHSGNHNDNVFIVRNTKCEKEIEKFAKIFEREISGNSLKYKAENDFPVNFGWNKGDKPTLYNYIMSKKNGKAAFTLETAYFGKEDNVFSVDGAIELGRCFAKAFIKYIE